MTLDAHQLGILIGALDSLAIALCEHEHTWTDGERAIYEEAQVILGNPPTVVEINEP